jgi:hypothetical protein
MYPNTPLTNAQAIAFRAAGFELGLHPQNNCSNFTPTSLESDYASQLVQFGQTWPGLPSPVTSRFHCIVYSDWASQPKTELRHGIRLDTNYYYWPGSWINNRPGFMTGSGMPMRFADTDGTIIDVYQAATQMTDESGQTYAATPDALLDNALGPLGYYGAFVANMHTDEPTTFEDDQLLGSATSHGVPVISAEQLLTWTDGRNGSSFGSLAYSANRLTFTVAAGGGANGLTAMVPTAAAGGLTLATLTRGSTAVPFTRSTVKGVEYALFPAAAGSYTATYAAGGTGLAATLASPTTQAGLTTLTTQATLAGLAGLAERTTAAADRTAPRLAAAAAAPLPDGTAAVTWRTDESTDATVVFGTAPDRLDGTGYAPDRQLAHAVVLTGLVPDRTYYYRLVGVDAAGNRTVWPASSRPPASFVSAAAGVADHSLAQWRMGSRGGTELAAAGLGRVSLASRRAGAGWYVSRVLDARAMVTWDRATWQADLPAGTSLVVSVRTGSTPAPGASWSGWQALAGPGARVLGSSRYLQYRLLLTTRAPGRTPALRAIGFTHNGSPPQRPTEARPG